MRESSTNGTLDSRLFYLLPNAKEFLVADADVRFELQYYILDNTARGERDKQDPGSREIKLPDYNEADGFLVFVVQRTRTDFMLVIWQTETRRQKNFVIISVRASHLTCAHMAGVVSGSPLEWALELEKLNQSTVPLPQSRISTTFSEAK